jgi:hypothetical protein
VRFNQKLKSLFFRPFSLDETRSFANPGSGQNAIETGGIWVFWFGCAGAAIADAAGDAQAVVTCGETEFPTPPTSPTLRHGVHPPASGVRARRVPRDNLG